MADEKIPEPKSGNAFQDGFLNDAVAKKAVKKLNREIKVKLLGALDGRVLYSEKNIVIDLMPMLGVSQKAYIILNGELVYGAFLFLQLQQPQ